MKKNLFDHLKSLSGSLAGPPRVAPLPVARVSSDSNSYGSFVNLKLTAGWCSSCEILVTCWYFS